jgi:heme oxygenase
LLAHLRLPGLLRAGRLRADIRVLTGTPEHKIDEQLEAASQNGHLAEFIAHTKQSVEANPHVLLAYAWVLYMALFSGGRYLRASLQGAGGSGDDFWNRDPSPVRPYGVTTPQNADAAQRRISKSEIPSPTERSSRSRSRNRSENEAPKMVPGLQFFNFLGDEDGEDIKREFKKRMTEAEIMLTSREKEDIIDEAEEIFKFMVEMVFELDSIIGTNEEDIETVKLTQRHPNLMTSRDSVAVAQERLMKKTRPMSNSLGEKIGDRKERKSSYFEVFVMGPVIKLVRFADEIPPIRSIRKTLSFPHDGKREFTSVKAPKKWEDGLWVGVPVLAGLIVFLAWFYTT